MKIPLLLCLLSASVLNAADPTPTPAKKPAADASPEIKIDGTEKKLPIALTPEIDLSGLILDPAKPPSGLKTDADLGVLVNDFMQVSLFHYISGFRADVVRAVKTPSGDYLAVVVAGEGTIAGKGHYAPAKIDFNRKANELLAYRSSDGGKTWTGPKVLFDVPYSMHGFIPLVPKGSKRIYCFGTEPIPALREGRENAPIGFRYSDDDGHTWSEPTLIKPTNDPSFVGMSCMQMTETDSGAWILGSHSADWSRPESSKLNEWVGSKKSQLPTRQYFLRSEDQGKTWTVVPGPRHKGWFLPEYDRLDEGRPIAIGGEKVLALVRTPEGHLWEMDSTDAGKTWTDPKPTTLVHPDAPPMFFTLSDGKTLIVLHHNNFDAARPHFSGQARNQLWASVSTDAGKTWSEPRFLMASANLDRKFQISYADLLADNGEINLFVPYGWRQTIQIRFPEKDLSRMPTRAELAARVPESSRPKAQASPVGDILD